MNKIIAIHNCTTIDRAMILSAFTTRLGTQMHYVSFIKPNGDCDLKTRVVWIDDLDAAQKYFDDCIALEVMANA